MPAGPFPADLPPHMRPERSFQGLILTLQRYWADYGCVVLQPYDMEVGAGTFHPATTLRSLGPNHWRAAYVQPSRRPKDGRYGENPNRLQHYYQFQVILKPSPPDLQDLYLGSLAAIGVDPLLHDIRFVEDDWESPTLGASGLGWECWCDGMEVSQFTYFQQVAGFECSPVSGELTYGLERLAMYVQGVENVYDLNFNGREGAEKVTYGDVFLQAEQEYSRHNFEHADIAMLKRHFADAETECRALLAAGDAGERHAMALPAYDQCIKASHRFNLLDARGAISVTERQSYILRVRELAKACGEAWLKTEAGEPETDMPDLLLELFSEEIPARMQAKASEDLKSLVTNALVERGVVYEGASAYATPRRLTLIVHGLPARQPDTREERKGPRVGAPEAAVQGFLRSAGLASIDQLNIQDDGKKGEFYLAIVEKPGRAVPELLAEIVPHMVETFPWPKSMRWGSGTLRWVRPLHSILCTFGPETEEPDIVAFEVGGIASGDTTRGHRFLAPGPIRARHFDDYVARLEAAKVVLDPARRREMILADARTLTFAQGFDLVEDEALLAEVAGLVEWPVVLVGRFDEAFLAVPHEAIQATIRANQKCFVVRDPKTGRLADRFVLVSNIEAKDGGAAIVAGNERVIRARLSDARFFWETDQRPLPGFEGRGKPLDQRLAKTRDLGVVFHEKIGTQAERVERIKALATALAPLVGADPALAARAAELAKADLATEMVGEFPELQGLMGRYYAQAQGEAPEVAAAIEDHYRPKGAGDRVPTEPVAIAVALADKLDTLVSFWAIGEKPTGSKDPFALRRAALGVIRIVLENGLRLKLEPLLRSQTDLLAFFADRLKVQLREQGARHDLVDAVFGLGGQDDLLLAVRRIEALGSFLDTEAGKSLLAGARRAANILRAEEKKDGAGAFSGGADASLLAEPQESALYAALAEARATVAAAILREDFAGAMAAMAQLRGPVDAFFDTILVNADDPALRRNRLRLLDEMRETTRTVADFSRVEG